MLELNGGSLPVNGDDKRLKAVTTDRDIVVNPLAQLKVLAQLGRVGRPGETHRHGAGESVEEATQSMQEYEVRRLPVPDCHELVRILRHRDIARNYPADAIGSWYISYE